MFVDKDINVIDKSCPMPLIALAKEVRNMKQGQTVRIVGNDPLFEESVIEFCNERSLEIMDTTRAEKTVTIVFRV